MKSFLPLLVATVTLALSAVSAQELVHQPSEVLNMPAAGEPLILRVFVTQTKRIDLPVYAHIVRDGQLMQVPLVGKLDDFERAIYSAEIPAPVADLAYQFLYSPFSEQATPVTSPRYASRRPCQFSTQPVAGTPPDVSSPEGRAELTQRAQLLESEVNVLSYVNEIVAKLREEVTDE